MVIKYKSRRHNTKRNTHHRNRHTIKLNKPKKHIHPHVKSYIGTHINTEEHDNREKSTFNTKYQHFDKVNLILSNLEHKGRDSKSRNGRTKINYRNYRRGFN